MSKSILSKDTVMMLTSKKKPSSNIHQTRTTGKIIKPMTIAEMKALRGPLPRKYPQPTTASKAKPWNSSIKVDKTKTLTKDGQMKHSTARKVLNFQPRPAANNRATMIAPVARKSIHPQVKASNGNGINRISGVSKIPETPVFNQPFPHRVPKLKMNNISFKSNGDDSFLQKEKEINDFEEKSNALTEEPTLEKIAEISPPVSTPFNDYRNVRDYFNNSEAEHSVLWNDNTIMSFEKPSEIKDNVNRDESVIVSLCEMLNKATVTNANNNNQELGELIEFERQAENNLKMIDNVMGMLNSMKEKQRISLQYIRKLKHDKLQTNGAKDCNVTVLEKEYIANNLAKTNLTEESKTKPKTPKINTVTVKEENVSPEKSPISSRPTVIKSRSPSYKIPRRSIGLRKKVFCKSMPNVSDGTQTPNKNMDRALSMYMQIKDQMTFLNTPLAIARTEIPDTPAITSHNLQKQLDKLYNER
ncbi:jg19154 [Pararge aegeria aegeria]|uniref:Jg19154 protein n=1 Tax=Pararge aegeria aegeria TaxID=348720 RepID=A0A8S4R846_9NEOP|nr:jg19154 [Pararge aegeria aegeria]